MAHTLSWERDYRYHQSFENHTEMSGILKYVLDPDIDFEEKPSKLPADVPHYLRILYSCPILTRHGERMLFLKMNYSKFMACRCQDNGDQIGYEHYCRLAQDARGQLARYNLRLVVHLAKSNVGPGQTLEEVISNGNLSMLRAIDKFDTNRTNQTGGTNKFSTYATYAIVRNFYRDRQGKKQVPIIDFDMQDCPLIDPRSLEDPDKCSDSILMLLRTLDDDHLLDERERYIIKNRFGLVGDEKTLDILGSELHVTKERVRQIQVKSMQRIRDHLNVRRKPRKRTASVDGQRVAADDETATTAKESPSSGSSRPKGRHFVKAVA